MTLATTSLTVLTEAGRGRLRPQAEALPSSGRGDRGRRLRQRRGDARRSARAWRELGDDVGRRRRAARARRVASVPRRSGAGRALRLRSAGRVPFGGPGRGGAGRCRTSPGSRSRAATSPRPRSGLQQSAGAFARARRLGRPRVGLGLLAFVRYNQGRLEEAVALAEHIAIDGRETGNRWMVGMMGVLIANVGLWTGRMAESVGARPGSDRVVPGDRRPVGRGHGDRPSRACARRARA